MPQRSTIRLISRVRGVALGLALTVTVAFSANPATAAESTAQPDYPKVLHQMVDAGKIQVVKQFATDKPGMTGYLVKRGGYQTVVYGEDGYLMLGPLYGPQGKNLSQ